MTTSSITEIAREIFDLKQGHAPQNLYHRLASMKRDEVRSLHRAIVQALPKPTEEGGRFRFVANSESSGLPFPCMNMSCRTGALAKTANFGAIYADEIILFSPLSHVYIPHDRKTSSHKNYILSLSNSLSHLFGILPLVEGGIVSFSDFDPLTICPSCFSKGLHESIDVPENYDLLFLAAEYFCEKAVVRVHDIRDGNFVFRVSNVSEIYGHDNMIYTWHPEVGTNLDWSIGYCLNREEIEKIEILQRPSTYFVNDLATVADISTRHNASNVLTSSTQLSLAQSYFGNELVKNAGTSITH